MQTRTEMQRELEATSVEMGVQKYRQTLAERGHGAVPAGKQLMLAAMRPMIDAVTAYLTDAKGGVAGRGRGVVNFIDQFDAETLAFITAQTVVGSLHERPSTARLCSRIGATLEQHMQIDQIAAGNKWLAAKIAKLRSQYSEKNHLVILRKVAERNDCQLIEWGVQTRARVGAILLELFMQSTELATVETHSFKDRKVQITRPTEACREWLENSHARCELLSPVRLPMVCRPLDWSTPFNGGYLSTRMRQPLVKTRNKNLLSELKHHEMPLVYAAVNALQATQWAVNEPVYETVKALWEASRGGSVVLPAREAVPVPAKSWSEGEEPDAETLKAWKWEAAKVHQSNAKAESRRLQLIQKLWVAEQMMEKGNLFHFVYNMDWRGRLYPVASGLNPQGDDVAKAMLRFAHGAPLGEEGAYWLAVHGANTFGVDKVSFEDRIAWVQEHEQLILLCAAGVSDFWMKADCPFQFLAFCCEYDRLQTWVNQDNEQGDFVSHLPVAFDGACNGLQNFSAMLRDEVGGAATGLIPGSKPSDIYTVVAQAAQGLIDKAASKGDEQAERWVGRMSRKLAKRNVMTVPYGVSQYGMRNQIHEELRKEGAEYVAADAAFIASKNYEAIGTVVVAARHAMDWLQAAAKVAASNGLPITWTTPVGFLARQDYRESTGDEVDFVALGRRYRFVLERDGDKLDTRRQSLGISPNYIHSMDAAHLIRTVLLCKQDGMNDFAMVHDSYGCHAGHASLLRDNLRQAFVDQYRPDTLAEFRDELAAQLPPELAAKLPPLPAHGKLDLMAVLQSDYFFA